MSRIGIVVLMKSKYRQAFDALVELKLFDYVYIEAKQERKPEKVTTKWIYKYMEKM